MKRIFLMLIVLLIFKVCFVYAIEIKEGVVITGDNYKKYAGELKKLLPATTFEQFIDDIKGNVITVPVVKKRKRPEPEAFARYTSMNEGKFKVAKDNRLMGLSGDWRCGLPFPKPENGAELAWNAYRRYQGPRDFLARPTYLLFSKSGKLERSFINFFFKKFFTNRGDVPPVPEIPGNNGEISVKIAMLILEPFDVKGFSFIRTVYEDIYKNDDVFSYLPALRRIRRLTGKDVCDPVLGSDSIYDDFENWQGKIKPGMKFRILGTKDFLTPAYITEPLHVVKGKSFQIDWEIRPLDLLEIQMNDPEHVYLKRIFYMDNESRMGITYYADGYDMKGRLWRGGTCGNVQYIEPGHWIQNWVTGIYRDQLTGHSSVLDFDLVNSVLHEVRIPMEWFTVRGLLKQCR